MNKAKLISERKMASKKEEIEAIRKKTAESGLGYVKSDLPPDEVDQKEVKKSNIDSLLSIIPYTRAWYESQAALEEMDNVKRLRIERVKATDLYNMTKIGRHEEALTKLMSETNQDFFYFNKLKLKAENEGKFHFEEPKLNPFSFMDKGKDQNRLKRAFNKILLVQENNIMLPLTKSRDKIDEKVKEFTCLWRMKNGKGEAMKCGNKRNVHPVNKEVLPYCSYHTSK